MDSNVLLTEAEAIVDRSDSSSTGVWPRAATYLVRQALELALDEYWLRGDPAISTLKDCSMETQLVCLPMFIEPTLAHQVAYVWTALSAACHFHPYELGPTAEELERWRDDVIGLVKVTSLAVPK